MKYLTDGVNLYEVIRSASVQNYGLSGGVFRYTFIRPADENDERVWRVDDLMLAALTQVA